MEFRNAPHYGIPPEYSYHYVGVPNRVPALENRQHYFRPLSLRMPVPNANTFLDYSSVGFGHTYTAFNASQTTHSVNQTSEMRHPNGNSVPTVLRNVKPIVCPHNVVSKPQALQTSPDASVREPKLSPECKSDSSVEMKTDKTESDDDEQANISVSRSSSPNTSASASTSEGVSPKSRDTSTTDASMPEQSPSAESKSSETEEIKIACK